MNRQLSQVLVRCAAVLALGPIAMKIGEWIGFNSYHFADSELLWSAFALFLWISSELSWRKDRKNGS